MPSVELSERAYREAEAAAASNGMSLTEYVEERLAGEHHAGEHHAGEHHAGEEAFTLTSEQLALVRQSQADLRNGLGRTVEETWASLDRRKADWRRENGL